MKTNKKSRKSGNKRRDILKKSFLVIVTVLMLFQLSGFGAYAEEAPTQSSATSETTSETTQTGSEITTGVNNDQAVTTDESANQTADQNASKAEATADQPAAASEATSETTATTETVDTPAADGASDPSAVTPQDPTETQTDIYTVTFTSNGTTFLTESIPSGEVAYDPGTPEIPTGYASFLGWYQVDTNGNIAKLPFDFSTQVTGDIQLVAGFSDKWAVLFEDANGKIVATQEVATGQAATDPGNIVTPPAGETFNGWLLDGQPYDLSTPVTQSITLKPNFTSFFYVYFVSKGTTVDTQTVNMGSTATQPTTPSALTGFDFKYWSASEDGSTGAFDFNTAITQNTYLYAIWTPKTVDYTIVYWFENSNIAGDAGTNTANYSYSQSQAATALAGSVVRASDLQAAGTLTPSTSSPLYMYGYYSFGDTVTIAGNGTSILNVYYKRTVYTLDFNLNGGSMLFNGVTYDDSNPYTLSAKYEQDISATWVSAKNATFTKSITDSSGNVTTYEFARWLSNADAGYATHRMTLTGDMCNYFARTADFKTGTGTFIADWNTNLKAAQVNYWLQLADDSTFDPNSSMYQEKDGKYYCKDNTYTQMINLQSNANLLPKGIQGFGEGVDIGSNPVTNPTGPYEYNFWYSRNIYTISFDTQGGSTIADVTGVRYEAPIASAKPADPTMDGAKFLGWYLDPAYTLPFDFSTATMPNADLKLYAKWDATSYKVSFYNHYGDIDSVASQMVAKNGFATDPGTYVKGKGYENLGEFQGWYWYLNGTPTNGPKLGYSWDNPVTRNLTVFAEWKTSGFKVTYSAGEGSGTVPVDNNEYALSVRAPVKSGDGLIAPTGKTFIGWQVDGTGTVYYPNSLVKMNGSTTMVALFTDRIAYLVFDANYPSCPDAQSWTVGQDSTVSLPKYDGVFTSSKAHYHFTGWNTAADCSGTSYAPEDIYTVGTTAAATTLYAQWEEDTIDINYNSSGNGSVDPAVDTAVKVVSGFTDNKAVRSTATASFGYDFVNWTNNKNSTTYTDAQLTTTQVNAVAKAQGFYEATTFTANFAPVNVTLTFANVSGTQVGNTKTGKYDQTFTAGDAANGITIDDFNLAVSLAIAKAADEPQNESAVVAKIREIQAQYNAGTITMQEGLDQLSSLGFTFNFTGWYTQSGNAGESVVSSVDPASAQILYNKDTSSIFSEFSATVYAHYSCSYNPPTYTIAYQPGDHGTFAEQTYTSLYGLDTPAFVGEKAAENGYMFTGWTPEVAQTVTGTATYVAQWHPIIYIQIAADTVQTTYDGAGHVANAKVIGVPDGYTVTGINITSAQATDAGTYTGSVDYSSMVMKDENGVDVTPYVEVTSAQTPTLTINPAVLTVTTGSASKTYDGNALTNADGSYAGLIGNETIGFAVTGSQTGVGTSPNTYTITWNGTAKQGNYTIVENLGTLEVTSAAIVAPVAPAGTGTPTATAAGTTGNGGTPTDGLTTISNDQTPLASNSPMSCWVHWFILLGIILTLIYGISVLIKRQNFINKLNDLEKTALGLDEEQSQAGTAVPTTLAGKEA